MMVPGATSIGAAQHRPSRWDGQHTELIMAWKKPRVTEVSLALEINSYACADLG
jgi:coenzyme PQQ precursor peptide PqqA